MRKFYIFVLGLFLFIILYSLPGSLGLTYTVSITPIEDAYANTTTGPPPMYSWSLLKFSLKNIPNDAIIKNAQLWLRAIDITNSAHPHIANCSNITWSDKEFDSTDLGCSYGEDNWTTVNSVGWWSWNATSFVNATYLDGTAPDSNITLILNGTTAYNGGQSSNGATLVTGMTGSWATFSSSTGTYLPVLNITYYTPAGENGCGLLDIADNIYTLTQDVNSQDTCFTIGANNVTLNCNGHAINYAQTSAGNGIYNPGYDRITIKNCRIVLGSAQTYSRGIYLTGSVYGANIHNNTIDTNGIGNDGIWMYSGAKDAYITNNTISVGAAPAIKASLNVNNVTIENNTLLGVKSSSTTGILIYYTGTRNIQLLNNRIYLDQTSSYGIKIDSSVTNVTIKGNVINTSSSQGSYAAYITTGISEINFINNIINSSSDRIRLDRNVFGVNLVNNTLIEGTIKTNYDIYLDLNVSDVNILNTKFNKSDVGFGNETCNFTVFEYIDINVTDNLNAPASGTTANISNSSSAVYNPILLLTTNSVGTVGMQKVIEYMAYGIYDYSSYTSQANFSLMSPYKVFVKKGSLVNSTTIAVNGTNSKQLTTQLVLGEPPDVDPPIISNINSLVEYTNATITWNTNESSSSIVRYGISPGNYSFLKAGVNGTTLHSVLITGLGQLTTYYYVVNSTDSVGNSAQSSEYSFTTNILPCTLTVASISANCLGGNSSACEQGETISLSGSYTGNCSAGNFMQIDARNTSSSCVLEYTGADMSGIFSNINPQGGVINGTWTIPSIPTVCQGKVINAIWSSLWNGNPGSGTWINTTGVSAAGDFTFYLHQPCNVTSLSISPNCAGGNLTDCEQGETISLSGSYTGNCSLANFLQIDARNTSSSCVIEYSGKDMAGIFSSVTPTGGSFSGVWTIPSIPTICQGKIINAIYGALWNGNPGSGTQVNGTNAGGQFKFYTPTCSDGTLYNSCSATKPLYCANGVLVNNCTSCGCSSGQSCNSTDKTCYAPCTLTSAIITSNCAGGNSTNCEQSETISLSGTYTGECSSGNLLQIDARNTSSSCVIEYSGQDMSGIYSSVTPTGGSFSGSWIIPSIPIICQGKTINAIYGALWQGFPGSGIRLNGTNAGGNFSFYTPTCSDGTKYSNCSLTKPLYCANGTLINNCTGCGCNSGLLCNSTTKACHLPTCSDGTNYSNCSLTKPLYCSNGTLLLNCTTCGCPTGQTCNATTRSCYTFNTTCSDNTPTWNCSATKPLYCANGTLVNNCTRCGCLTDETCNATNQSCYPSINNCSDGTLFSTCSVTKPLYCLAGSLVDNCNVCGCPLGQDCNATSNSCYVPLSPCILTSASISGNCAGGSSTFCEQGETISLSGSYTGNCSAGNFMQIDARNTSSSCVLEYTGADMSGIFSNINPQGGVINGTWTIPSIPTVCQGKVINAIWSSLWNGNPGSGTWINTTGVSAAGDFTFYTPVAPTCSDGTLYNQCSATKPLYCDSGSLINNCTSCACPSGQLCNMTDQSCFITPATQYSRLLINGRLIYYGSINRCENCTLIMGFLDVVNTSMTDSLGNFSIVLEPSTKFNSGSYVINGTITIPTGRRFNFKRTINVV